jgi:hypothetical protein
MTASIPTLPTAFLLIAEAALISGGHDASTPNRLREAARHVSDVITTDNLLTRRQELTSAADTYIKARGGQGISNAGDFRLVSDAVEVGLVAGFLIAQVLAGKEP